MFKSLKNNISDLLTKAGAITENGTTYFKGFLGQIRIFSSSEALIVENQLYDETHYLLVPDRDAEHGYSLYTKRVLPQGYSSDNELEKRRIFQLPHEASIESLDKLLHEEARSKVLNSIDQTSPIADRLDVIAQEIDAKSNHITNGLLIIGGVVAIANPLLGVGIAVKALLPSLGSKVTTHGLDHLSGILKTRNSQAAQKEADKAAKKELHTLKKSAPEIKINPALKLLHQALHNSDPEHDPLTESLGLWNNLNETRHILIASEAITTIYASRIKTNHSPHLHPNDIAWLQSLSK